jgi:hypothetical protein
MKTLEVIRASEAALAPLLGEMKLKELEKHGQNLVRILGGEDYRVVLYRVIKALPGLSEQPADRFQALQAMLQELLPKSPQQPDVLAKLTVILTRVVTLKFSAIHEKKP